MLQRYEREAEYTERILKLRQEVASEYRKYRKENISDLDIIKSLEAKIGSKSNELAKIESRQFFSASEYRDAWISGLLRSSNMELKSIMRNETIRQYIVLFLERSYVKNPEQYTKLKLEDCDRELYLGDNENVIGVFVAPRNELLTNYEWKSYLLKGLKVKYTYLTLGQLKEEGYLKGKIVEGQTYNANLIKVRSFNDIVEFYENFKRSGSPFERLFVDKYIDYVNGQKDWTKVPILLPEVRWDKKAVCHRYRADYLIINYYTGDRLVELSPDSTHLIHKEAKQDWKKENDKRNSYFFKYKVPTVTYTNSYLEDMNECFTKISALFERPIKKLEYEELIKEL